MLSSLLLVFGLLAHVTAQTTVVTLYDVVSPAANATTRSGSTRTYETTYCPIATANGVTQYEGYAYATATIDATPTILGYTFTFQEGATTKAATTSHTRSTSTFSHGKAVWEYAGVDEQCVMDQEKKSGACRRVEETNYSPKTGLVTEQEPTTTKTTYWTGELTPIATLTVDPATLALIGASPTTSTTSTIPGSGAGRSLAHFELTVALLALPSLLAFLFL